MYYLMAKRTLHQLWAGMVEGRKRGLLASLLRVTLMSLSLVYGLIVQSILFLYRLRILKRRRLPALVISVGNITVGGTGKTPLVEMLVERLQSTGHKVAVLSRGYGRKSGSRGHRASKVSVVSDGKNILMGVREGGDEPYLLAGNLPGVPVVVGKDRRATGSYAIDKFGVDTIVLDDGYQYWPLVRDLDIVVIDSTNPFGTGHLLPRGRLREPVGNLKRAHLFFLSRVDQVQDTETLKRTLKKINPEAGLVETIYCPQCLVEFTTGRREELSAFKDKPVLALSSIGHPGSFERMLVDLGVRIAEKIRFPDHHWYQEPEMREVEETVRCRGADLIITTQKDAVRFPPKWKLQLPVYYLAINLRIVKGEEVLGEWLDRACQSIGISIT